MPRKKKISRKTKIDPVLLSLLSDQDAGIAKFLYDDETLERAWQEHSEEILKSWIKEHPGTRPSCWWQFETPKERKITGKFILLSELYPALLSYFFKGIPQDVETEGEVFVESEASYLLRHNLFLKGEKSRLKKEDFEPVLYSNYEEMRNG